MTRTRVIVASLSLLTAGLTFARVAPAATWSRLDQSSLPFKFNIPSVTGTVVNGTEVVDIYSAVDDPGMGVAVTQLLVNAIPQPVPLGTTLLQGAIHNRPAGLRLRNDNGSVHQEVWVIGLDNALWHQSNDGGVWPQVWNSLGKPPGTDLCSTPSPVSWTGDSHRMDVFVIGCDHQLWQMWNDGVWHSWAKVGTRNFDYSSDSPVTAIARGPLGVLDVFAVEASTYHLWDTSFSHGWQSFDTKTIASAGWVTVAAADNFPTAVVPGNYNFSTFLAAENKNSYRGQFWSPPLMASVGGPTFPVALFDFGFIQVYYLEGVTGLVKRKVYEPGSYNFQGVWFARATNNLTSDTFSGGVGGWAPYTMDGILVFAVKPDGTMWWALDTEL